MTVKITRKIKKACEVSASSKMNNTKKCKKI